MHRSADAGGTWTALSEGLPGGHYNAVLRDAACVDTAAQVGVYLGTRAGDVYASRDEGTTFTQVVDRLPDILSLRAAVVTS